jgi:predicted permease
MLRDLWQDLRHGLRAHRRRPGFTAMVVLTLGLGIGANVAIFSLTNAVLLRPLPVRNPGELVLLSDAASDTGKSVGHPGKQGARMRVYSHPLYQRLRAEQPLFAGLAAEDGAGAGAIVRYRDPRGAGAGVPEVGDGAYWRAVSANYFDVLGVPAALGRTFSAEDERAREGARLVVLSHGYWQRRFGGDPAVVGARIDVNTRPFTVIGVAAAGFTGTKVADATDLWVPLALKGDGENEEAAPFLRDPQWSWLLLVGRLAPGVPRASAEASANQVLRRHLAELPTRAAAEAGAGPALRIVLEPGGDGFTRWRRGFRDTLYVLTVGAGLLLVIVCLNVGHLMLARALHRQREMSIRTALGATRARLLRQLLVEGLLLAAAGVAVAALISRWLNDGLLALTATAPVQNALIVGADVRVVAFTGLSAAVTALVVGLVPAWLVSRAEVQQGLRAGAPAVAGAGPRRLASRLLLGSQVALSLVLLVGAGLLAGTLGRMRDAERGFDRRPVLLIGVGLEARDVDRIGARALEDDLLRQVRALPGVRHAGLSRHNPVDGSTEGATVLVDGAAPVQVNAESVTPGYFEALVIPVTRGRSFTREDHGGAARVAVVNDALARRLWAPERSEDGGDLAQALGRRFRFAVERAGAPLSPEPFEVVGVVGNTRSRNLTQPARPMVYVMAAQSMPVLLRSLIVQAEAGLDPALLADRLRPLLPAVHPRLFVSSARTMVVEIDRTLARPRMLATLATVFGLAALFLVSLGLYGVISQWGIERTREIGVRMALGATAGGVRWLVLRQAFVLVLAGVAVGIPAALATAQLLKGVLFGVAPTDAATFAAATLALGAVATLAAYLPARRASRVDPMVSLRVE